MQQVEEGKALTKLIMLFCSLPNQLQNICIYILVFCLQIGLSSQTAIGHAGKLCKRVQDVARVYIQILRILYLYLGLFFSFSFF